MNLWSRSRTSGFQWALSQVSPCHGAGSSFMTQRTLEETSALAKQEAEDDRSQCVQRCGFVSWILESPCRSEISKGDQTWWNQCRETLLETDPHEAEELGHCFCQKILSRWPELVTFGDSVQALVFCSSVPPLHDCPYPELWTDSGIHPEVLETSWNCTEPNSTSNRRCFDDKTMSNSESKHVWYFRYTCHVLDGAAVWSIKHCKGSDPESEGLRPPCCPDPWFSFFLGSPCQRAFGGPRLKDQQYRAAWNWCGDLSHYVVTLNRGLGWTAIHGRSPEVFCAIFTCFYQLKIRCDPLLVPAELCSSLSILTDASSILDRVILLGRVSGNWEHVCGLQRKLHGSDILNV